MKNILAIRSDNNGDVTLMGPALRALTAQGMVTLGHGPSGAGAAALLPGVVDRIMFRAEWIEANPEPVSLTAVCDLVRVIASREFDEAFIFTSFHQSALPLALLLRMAGVPKIHAISVEYPGSLLDTRHRCDDDIHEVERALSLVATRGYALPRDDDGRLAYVPLPEIARFALPRRYIVVQPGASVEARTWPAVRWRAAVASLAASGYVPVVVGSADEAALCAFVAAETGAIDLSGQTTFAEFAAVVKAAGAIVVGNTSGVHAASAVGTPVVTIFPPTIPFVRFAPWRVPYAVLGDHGIACAGCRARVCPIPGQPCLDAVRPRDVLHALAALSIVPERRLEVHA